MTPAKREPHPDRGEIPFVATKHPHEEDFKGGEGMSLCLGKKANKDDTHQKRWHHRKLTVTRKVRTGCSSPKGHCDEAWLTSPNGEVTMSPNGEMIKNCFLEYFKETDRK